MTTHKTTIRNQNNQGIVVMVEIPENPVGLAFVAHGLSGNKEQPHIQAFAEAFQEQGYITVRWDARNTLGESEGSLEEATLTSYFEDFQTVVEWAQTQDWYQAPFIVCGHSLGAACSILYTLQHPEKVKALAPISAFLSGNVYADTKPKAEMEQWQKTGWKEETSVSRPGLVKRFRWKLMEDLLTYELTQQGKQITQSVLLVVGSEDTSTPPQLQQEFYEALPHTQKELHSIEGAEHTFREEKHLQEIKRIMKEWINTLENEKDEI